ncbi:unnamed protein product [Calicophoron daubneyi]|uniref:Tetraspanin n=1 Tax=Calicophoron daubneyi TaxID=300641 RepID=A0AAV2T337_CALDB
MCKSCASCVRILMIVFNIVFTIIGIVILGAGLYFYFSTFGLQGLDQYNILAYTFIGMIIIGSTSLILGILGCCGSYHYSRCLLGFYFALLLIIFALEVAIGVAGFVRREDVRKSVREMLEQGVKDRAAANPNELRWMDTIQIMFQCCGYNGQIDYGLSPPSSCCRNLQCELKDALIPYLEGCKQRMDSIMYNFFVIGIVVVVIALVELIGLIFSMTLCCAVSGRGSSAYYEAVQT